MRTWLSRSVTVFFCGIVFSVVACVSGATMVQSDEYGFRAAIPDGLPVCRAEVLSHVHGVGSVLDGSDCQRLDRAPSFKMWADFNSAFVPNALDVLKNDPRCAGVLAAWATAEWANAIGGLRTAMCTSKVADGSTVRVLLAQSGAWPRDTNETAPRINYTVVLTTTSDRLKSDTERFREFVKSIEVTS